MVEQLTRLTPVTTINANWRDSLKDVRVFSGASAGCAHYIVLSRVKLKFRKQNRPTCTRQHTSL